MNRNHYILILISLFFSFVLFPSLSVEAKEHKLEELRIHTYIHKDGSATITETRIATLNEGTENYDIVENLGKSTIRDFTVSENDRIYQFIENWNIDASREDKAFKNGLIKTANGYELVWGIGEYGNHEYKLKYTVTDFIKQLEDSQILFWRFVNDEANIPPEKLTIVIESDQAFSDEDEKIWGFGFKGSIYFEDDRVVAHSNEPLKSSDYATILMKFADDQFSTTDVLLESFDEIKEQAFIGSDYDDNESSTVSPPADNSSSWLVFFIPFIVLSPFFFFILGILILWYVSYRRKKDRRKLKGEYERDIPYDGPFVDLYHLLTDMHVTKFENLIAAFLLKWIKEELIEIDEEDVGILFKSKVPIIYINEQENIKEGLEGELYRMLLEAADSESKLKSIDFSTWIERNRKQVRSWEKDVKKASQLALTENNLLKEIRKRFFLFKRSTYELTSDGRDLKVHTYKFMNYLEDFSLLGEHEPVNVKLWDELMIWAAVLGITEEVYKQFQKLYPSYARESSFSYVSITSTTSLSRSVSSSKSIVRSGGGGGSVSGGGGGGSFGGGSGGGTR